MEDNTSMGPSQPPALPMSASPKYESYPACLPGYPLHYAEQPFLAGLPEAAVDYFFPHGETMPPYPASYGNTPSSAGHGDMIFGNSEAMMSMEPLPQTVRSSPFTLHLDEQPGSNASTAQQSLTGTNTMSVTPDEEFPCSFHPPQPYIDETPPSVEDGEPPPKLIPPGETNPNTTTTTTTNQVPLAAAAAAAAHSQYPFAPTNHPTTTTATAMNLPHPQHHPLQPFRITPRTLFQTVPDYRRRSYPESAADVERMNKHASRRASHNIVEKRYRVNLNSKFRQLEDVVDRGKNSRAGGSTSMATSTAATATATATATGTSSRRQQSPKAAILDGALTYIAALEKENRALREKLEGKEDKNENETENGLDGGPCGGTDPDSDPGTQKDDPQRLLVYSPGEILPLRPSCAHNIGVNVKREGRSP